MFESPPEVQFLTKGNIKKEQLLQMSLGKANNILRKSILFSLVQRCGLDICYRCSKRIRSEAEFSIEHKDAWLFADDPVKAFFNLENISFSHLKCNVSAGARRKIHVDGNARTRSYYHRHPENNKSRYLVKKAWRQKRRDAGLPYT